jgi:hypothetical protein
MPPIGQSHPPENTPQNRDRTQSRLRHLTRGVVISATGAAAAIGIVVAHAHPGAGSTAARSGSSGTTATSSGTGGTATSGSASSGNTGTTGNTGGSSPTTTTTAPVVTSGGTSA